MTIFSRLDNYWKLIILIFPLVLFFSFSKPIEPGYDFWEHAASVREPSKNLFHPSNPFLQLPGSTSPRFIPFTVLLGMIAHFIPINIFTLMALTAVVNYFLFAISLNLFINTFYRDQRMPLYVLLICWLFWGRGWDYSNSYQFEVFLVSLTDPYIFSYALSFFILFILLIFLRSGQVWTLVWLLILNAINFVNHPPTAAFCLIFGLAIVITAEKMYQRRGLLFLFLVIIALVVASMLWPYFSYYKTFFHGLGDKWFHAQLYSNIAIRLGPAIFGLPVMFLLCIKQQYRFILVGFILSTTIYCAGYLAGIEMGERFILFSAFFLHLAIATYLREKELFSCYRMKGWFAQIRALKSNSLSEYRLLITMVVVIICIFSIIFRVQAMSKHLGRVLDIHPKLTIHNYESPVNKYLVLDKYLDSSDIVLSDLLTSWMIPAITGAKVVAVFHNNPLLGTENTIREAAMRTYFDSTTSFVQRNVLLQLYCVTHVVVNFNFVNLKKANVVALMQDHGVLLAEVNDMMIYQITNIPK